MKIADSIVRDGYHVISNEGEVPWQLFTLLGGSMTRGSENTIGEFGSGSKYSIELLLRKGLSPVIYSGLTKIEFFSDKQTIKDAVDTKVFDVICMRITEPDNSRVVNTAMSLQHGIQEWTDIRMAAREFVANALDMQQRYRGNRRIDIDKVQSIDDITPEAGVTKVIIPMEASLNEFFRHIDTYFLHFSEDFSEDTEIFPNTFSDKETLIYRCGVRSATIKKKSLFCYNSKLFKLTESRVVTESEASHAAARIINYCTDTKIWATLLRSLNLKNLTDRVDELNDSVITPTFEDGLPVNSFKYSLDTNIKLKLQSIIKSTFSEVFGENALLCKESDAIKVINKGFKPIAFSYGWYSFLSQFLTTAEAEFNKPAARFSELSNPNEEISKYYNKLFKGFSDLDLLSSKVPLKVGRGDETFGTFDVNLNVIIIPARLADTLSNETKKAIVTGFVKQMAGGSWAEDSHFAQTIVKLVETSAISFED